MAKGYKKGAKWHGEIQTYECDSCQYVTHDERKMVEHQRRHGTDAMPRTTTEVDESTKKGGN